MSDTGKSIQHVMQRGRRRMPSRAMVAAAVAAALVVAGTASLASANPTAPAGLPAWPTDPEWQRLVSGPSSDDVRPVGVVRTHGAVANPGALTSQSPGSTVMTVNPGGPSAIVVLDFGREVGGTPYVNVSASTPTAPGLSNTLRVSTSEALTFLNTNKTTALTVGANTGVSNVKVASVAPFYAGSPVTVDTGTAGETRTVTTVGTSAAPNTSLVLGAAPGETNVAVANVAGYTNGSPLTVDTGAGAETTTISAVGTAAGAPTTVVYPAGAGASNIQVANVAGFADGQRFVLDTDAGLEIRTVGTVGTAATTSQLFAAAVVGDTNLKVTSVSGLTVGADLDIDPGPNQDHVTVTSVGTAGTNSTVAAQNVTSGLAVPSLTGANWIWNVPNANSSTPAGTIYLRKTFTVADPAALASAILRVNADDGHTTYVNGAEVSASGGANNAWQTSQISDIKSLLVPGTNVIAIAASNAGSAGSVITAAQLDSTRIVTDATWKALPGTPASPPAGWNTVGFDDSSWPAANISGAYGITPWNTNVQEPAGPTTLRVATVAGFVAGDTIAIGSGANQETRVIQSVGTAGATGSGLTLATPLSIIHALNTPVLDLSKPGTGLSVAPALTGAHDALATVASPGTGIAFAPALATSHAAGTTARGLGSGITFAPALTGAHAAGAGVASTGSGITFSPALTNAHPLGATVTGIGTYANDNGAQINLSVSGPQTYTGGLRGGFRFASIELTTPGTVMLTGAGVNFKAYRAGPDKYQGWFMSSDDQLNRIWYAGAYTAQMDMVPTGVSSCFNTPVIFDGAKRDRAIWSGDLMVTNPVALLSIGTNSVPYVKGAIDSIMNLQAASGRLTSAVGFRGCGAFDYAVTYSAYSAIIAVQYYRYSGDTAYITGLLPKLEAASAYHATRLDANGLVVTNDPDYWQTTQSGEVTEYSLAYYELLQKMIWLEGKVGTATKVTEYTDKAVALKTAINTRLWNAAAGLYQQTDTGQQHLSAGREHERDPSGRRTSRPASAASCSTSRTDGRPTAARFRNPHQACATRPATPSSR